MINNGVLSGSPETAGIRPAADTPNLDEACSQAMMLQLAGQLELAAQAYRAILDAEASHAAANHCFGMLNVQLRQAAAALPFLLVALNEHPEIPGYWLGYLEALLQAGETDSAQETLALARQHGLSGPAVDEFTARLVARVSSPTTTIDRSASSAKRPFIVVAPDYTHRSAGIRVLHTLCNELNLCGHIAHLIFYRFKPDGGGTDFYTPEDDTGYCKQHEHISRLPGSTDIGRFRTLIDEAIVVYPEVLQGNPLNAARVVRYVLNDPAANGYPMLEGKRDFIVSFNQKYWPNPHSVASLFMDEPVFHDDNTRPALERTMDCTYAGKGAAYGPCFRIPGSVTIERNWPADKEGLAILLRNTRYFFTWDVNTLTNADALLCGAIIVVPRWAPFTREIFDTSYGPIPYADSSIENGVISVLAIRDDHELKRRHIIDSIKAAARDRTQTVRRLAGEIEDYFAKGEMWANPASAAGNTPVVRPNRTAVS